MKLKEFGPLRSATWALFSGRVPGPELTDCSEEAQDYIRGNGLADDLHL